MVTVFYATSRHAARAGQGRRGIIPAAVVMMDKDEGQPVELIEAVFPVQFHKSPYSLTSYESGREVLVIFSDLMREGLACSLTVNFVVSS